MMQKDSLKELSGSLVSPKIPPFNRVLPVQKLNCETEGNLWLVMVMVVGYGL